MAGSKNTTIQDIATLLGLSKSTVSRALNNNTVIAEDTRRRVAEAARSLKFTKNVSAQRLSQRQSRTIAFVTHASVEGSQASDLFGLEIMSGVSQGLQALGYEMLVKPIDYRDYSWVRKLLDSGQVDGFVLMTSSRKAHHTRALVREKAPFIAWGAASSSAAFPSVCADNRMGGVLVGRYLAGLGVGPLAVLAGPAEELEVQGRTEGFLAGVSEAGGGLDPRYVLHGDYSEADGYRVMEELLRLDPPPRAVFAEGDLMAIGALKAAKGRGLKVPGDVAIVGFDNLMVSSYTDPPLTTVSQHLPQGGVALAQGLVRYLETGQISHVVMPVELIRRGSA